MKSNHYDRKEPAQRDSDPEQMLAKIQAATEEMTMHRYVHSIPKVSLPCRQNQRRDTAALERQLDEQNRILNELVQSVKGFNEIVKGFTETARGLTETVKGAVEELSRK